MRKMDNLVLKNVQINCLSSNRNVFKTCLRQIHTWRTDTAQWLEWRTAGYVQRWNWAQTHQHPLTQLIPRGRSRSRARPGSGCRALFPRLGSPIVLLRRWWAWGSYGGAFFLSILYRGRWSTAGLLVTARLLGSAAGTALRLYDWAALWAGLALGWTGAGLLGARARLWLVGSRAGPARLWFPFSRVPSRPWTGAVVSFVAARARPVKQTIIKVFFRFRFPLKSKESITGEPCRSLTESGT